MSASFLLASASRERDAALLASIHPRLTFDSHCWSIEWRPIAGRCLVAKRPIAAGMHIFTEMPLIVARGGSGGVARAILALDRESAEFDGVCQLQGCTAIAGREATEEWAKRVAAINVHGAGGNVVDPSFQRRGVLGLLASMMQHECAPSAIAHISSVDEGSAVSLYSIRDLAVGELISISYCGSYQPTATRRQLLKSHYGFTCVCLRCISLPEHVRAFWCPNCGDGPCSPALPAAECRELLCDECGVTMGLDDETWGHFEGAERASDVGECMQTLHPYHHRIVKMYQLNLLKLSGQQRAEVLQQHAAARVRMYSSFAAATLAHALVANDIEAAAVGLLGAGDTAASAEVFQDAAQRFASFYGAASADVVRCSRASEMHTLAEYHQMGGEVLAHH